MNLIEALTREHDALRRLIRRIDSALVRADEDARAEVRVDLLVLLEALQRHEEIEAEAFEGSIEASGGAPDETAAELKREHEEIGRLRDEARAILEDGGQAAWTEVVSRAGALCRGLLEHFQSEESRERRLETRAVSRTRARTLARRVDLRVRALLKEIERVRGEASDYLTRRR